VRRELRETFDLAQRLAPFAHPFKELRVLNAIPNEQRPRLAPDLPAVLTACVAAAERRVHAVPEM